MHSVLVCLEEYIKIPYFCSRKITIEVLTNLSPHKGSHLDLLMMTLTAPSRSEGKQTLLAITLRVLFSFMGPYPHKPVTSQTFYLKTLYLNFIF